MTEKPNTVSARDLDAEIAQLKANLRPPWLDPVKRRVISHLIYALSERRRAAERERLERDDVWQIEGVF